jgi:hypothetical protein
MKRIRIVGLCLVVVFATAAVLSASAFAAAPEFGKCVAKAGGKYKNNGCTEEEAGKEKYEWEPLSSPVKFESEMPSGDKATLESEKKSKVVCTKEHSVGEIGNAHEVKKVVATFENCEFSGLKCSTKGSAEGEIVTVPMDGGIGYEKEGTKGHLNAKLAEELKPESGTLFVTFECVGTEIKVKGSILHPISDNKMVSTETEKFTQSKGVNKPNHYLGEPEHTHDLEAKFGATAEYEHSGQTVTTKTTFEEKIEANAVV